MLDPKLLMMLAVGTLLLLNGIFSGQLRLGADDQAASVEPADAEAEAQPADHQA